MPRPLRATPTATSKGYPAEAQTAERCSAALCTVPPCRSGATKRKEKERKSGCCRRTDRHSLIELVTRPPKTGDGCEGRPSAQRHRHYFWALTYGRSRPEGPTPRPMSVGQVSALASTVRNAIRKRTAQLCWAWGKAVDRSRGRRRHLSCFWDG